MALQGTLETFELPDVLRLLSSTKKTGLLELDGDRGVGRVWLADGAIASGSSERESGTVEAVLFDLLRTTEGSFVFENGALPHDDGERTDVDEALGAAQALLDDWRTIASVVPSLAVRVRLVDELGVASVEVDADQWRILSLVGNGTTGQRIDAHLELGELECCRRIAGMVEAGMVEIDEIDEVDDFAGFENPSEYAGPEVPATSWDAATSWESDPVLVDHDLSTDEVASLGANLASFVAQPPTADVPLTLPVVEETPAALDEERFESVQHDALEDERFESVPDGALEEEDLLLSDMGDGPVGDMPAPDGIEAFSPVDDLSEDELNRNLLLKFLSSTKS